MNCPICKRPLAGTGRCYTCNVDNMVLFAEHLERKAAWITSERLRKRQRYQADVNACMSWI